jgi:hypothetical protein
MAEPPYRADPPPPDTTGSQLAGFYVDRRLKMSPRSRRSLSTPAFHSRSMCATWRMTTSSKEVAFSGKEVAL